MNRKILRSRSGQGCRLTVVPRRTTAAEALALAPDGIFLSNGPGDPEPCDYAITAIREILDTPVPVFGICLGHQLLAIAAGARTMKMKFGHHGANHPVLELANERVMITSQNHGFAVNREEAEAHPDIEITHVHLNDHTVAGLKMKSKNCFSVQYHPEASPGPHDSWYLFDQFIDNIKTN